MIYVIQPCNCGLFAKINLLYVLNKKGFEAQKNANSEVRVSLKSLGELIIKLFYFGNSTSLITCIIPFAVSIDATTGEPFTNT